MKNNILKTIKSSIKHWYLLLIVGALFIGVGVYTLTSPQESYLALSIVFSLSFLFSGLMEIIFSISNKDELENWGWTLALGILTFLIGVLLIMHPQVSVATLPFYVGFVVLFRSIMGISYSLELKDHKVLDWGYLMLVGVLGVLFSFLLLWNPLFAGMTIVFWTGIALIMGGIFNIYLSFKLKGLKALPSKISAELQSKFESVKQEIQDELNKTSEEVT